MNLFWLLKRSELAKYCSASLFVSSLPVSIFISYFTTSNPQIFNKVITDNVGILLQTEEEWYQLRKFGVNAKMIASPSFLSDKEIDSWSEKNVPVNLASLEEVKYWIKKHGTPMSFRLDLTFRQNQRTGIKKRQLDQLSSLLKQAKIAPKSIHVYCGTGSDIGKVKKYLKKTLKIWRKYFPEVKEINLGGGFGFDYENTDSDKKHFDWREYFDYLSLLVRKYQIPVDVKFLFEPGRDILADVGQMVLCVKRIVKFPNSTEISTDGSYVYMPSATKRKRIHNLIFFDNNFKEIKTQNFFSNKLSGSTTLSSDYILPLPTNIPVGIKEGDYIAVQDVGAYGATQHMEFLNKKPCPEVFVDNRKILLITERGLDTDKVRYVLENPKEIK